MGKGKKKKLREGNAGKNTELEVSKIDECIQNIVALKV